MSGHSSHPEAFDLAGLLAANDLTPRAQRIVFDVVADSMIEGAVPDRQSVVDLIELAAGRLDGEECRRRIIARSGRRQASQ